MANRYAVASGDWSDTGTWDGGTLPGPGDDVRPNNHTVTVDQDVTVDALRSDAESPAVAGGTFAPADGVTITADIYGTVTTTGATVTSTASDVTIHGDLYSGSGAGTSSRTAVAVSGAAATMHVIGDLSFVDGVTTNNKRVADVASSATLHVTGDVYGNPATGTGPGIFASSATAVHVDGDVYGSAHASASGVEAANSPTTVTGICRGGETGAGPALSGTGPFFIGEAHASALAPAVDTTGHVVVSGPLHNHPSNNRSAISAAFWWVPEGSNFVWHVYHGGEYPAVAGDPLALSTHPLGTPATADVRAGVSYGYHDEHAGTLAVPPPETVALGVPTDDTTGTLDPGGGGGGASWDTPVSELTEPGSIGARLAQAATVATTGAQIAAALDT